MIQFNLLPDVKLEYIKARRLKRTVILIGGMIAAVSLLAFVLVFISVTFVKPEHLENLDKDIQSNKSQLQQLPDLSKILTVQNQLNGLPALHADKPVTSRIFTYIQQLAPQQASITSLTVNFDEQSMVVTGGAPNLAAVNTFVDTLKFTTYSTASDNTAGKTSFSEVVLSQFSVGENGTNTSRKAASYTITLKYVPEIFSGDIDSKLVIPDKVTTRSETEKPANVFEPSNTNGGTE